MSNIIKFLITGIAPLIMHNGQLADPTNEWSKAMKKITSRKKKTDADFLELKRTEWFGGLYLDEDGKRPVIPADVVLGTVIAGAKKHKNGVEAKAGIYEAKPYYELQYDGPKNLDKLFDDGRFCDYRSVRNQQNRVMRSRPIFKKWSAVIELLVDPEIIDPAKVIEAMESAGERVGIGDYRPRYGRFAVEVMT